jgi:PBSX family phage terminase large subunit
VKVAPLIGKQLTSYELADARLNIWEGSVRSSKTVSSLVRWLRFVRDVPPGNLMLVGKTERTLKRNIIDPLTEMLGAKRCRYAGGSGELWLLGRRIYIVGANDERAQEKIRGISLIGVYCDEISTWPESFWSMLLSRLSEEGAKLFGTSNPDSPAHWLKAKFLDRAGLWLDHAGNVLRTAGDGALDLARFSFRLADNPHLPAAYIRSLELEYTGLWRKRFILGLWVAAEGAIYDMWDPDLMVVDIIPPITNWLCAAIDYGTSNPLHAVLLGIGADRCLYAVAEYRHDSRRAHRQFTDAEYSQAIRAWLQQVPIPATRRPDGSWLQGVQPHYVIVDPSAASFRVQLHRDGMNPVLGSNEVLDGIRTVSSLLATGNLKISRDCPELIAELPGYSWDDKAAKAGEDKPVKLNDHGVDALRYGCMTTRGIWQSQIRLTVPAAQPDPGEPALRARGVITEPGWPA